MIVQITTWQMIFMTTYDIIIY